MKEAIEEVDRWVYGGARGALATVAVRHGRDGGRLSGARGGRIQALAAGGGG